MESISLISLAVLPVSAIFSSLVLASFPWSLIKGFLLCTIPINIVKCSPPGTVTSGDFHLPVTSNLYLASINLRGVLSFVQDYNRITGIRKLITILMLCKLILTKKLNSHLNDIHGLKTKKPPG